MKRFNYFAASFLAISCFALNLIAAEMTPASIVNQWIGKEYHENSQLQFGWADSFFFKHYPFAGTEKVLDIGAGDGKITARIADQVPYGSVIGIDNSRAMVEEANKLFSKKPNLTMMLKSGDDEGFYHKHRENFDLIVSFSTLHWIKNQEALLKGVRYSLKPHGKFYFKLCSKGGDPIQDIADLMKDEKEYKNYFKEFTDPMRRYSSEEYKALLKQANLTVISIKDVEEQDKIHGKEKLVKQIKSWLPHYHYLKKDHPEVAKKYINAIIEVYLKKYPAKEGEITLYDHYLEVVGGRG